MYHWDSSFISFCGTQIRNSNIMFFYKTIQDNQELFYDAYLSETDFKTWTMFSDFMVGTVKILQIVIISK